MAQFCAITPEIEDEQQRSQQAELMFHIRIGKHARAFHPQPQTIAARISMYLRGWRDFGLGGWWSKLYHNEHERQH